jgi:hypothetical protein
VLFFRHASFRHPSHFQRPIPLAPARQTSPRIRITAQILVPLYHPHSPSHRQVNNRLCRADCILFFRFFVTSCSSLAHPSSIELYFLEAKSQLAKVCCSFSGDDTNVIVFRAHWSWLILTFTESAPTCCRSAPATSKSTVTMMNYFADPPLFSDQTARALLRQVLPVPKRILMSYCISHIECEDSIIELYKELTGTSRGSAKLRFVFVSVTPLFNLMDESLLQLYEDR